MLWCGGSELDEEISHRTSTRSEEVLSLFFFVFLFFLVPFLSTVGLNGVVSHFNCWRIDRLSSISNVAAAYSRQSIDNTTVERSIHPSIQSINLLVCAYLKGCAPPGWGERGGGMTWKLCAYVDGVDQRDFRCVVWVALAVVHETSSLTSKGAAISAADNHQSIDLYHRRLSSFQHTSALDVAKASIAKHVCWRYLYFRMECASTSFGRVLIVKFCF